MVPVKAGFVHVHSTSQGLLGNHAARILRYDARKGWRNRQGVLQVPKLSEDDRALSVGKLSPRPGDVDDLRVNGLEWSDSLPIGSAPSLATLAVALGSIPALSALGSGAGINDDAVAAVQLWTALSVLVAGVCRPP
jgi:hypothetical protein